jgi:hypothetical protein
MLSLIAACGLDCAQCDSYRATQAKDMLMLEATVVKWTKEYNASGLTVENIQCDGCMTPGRKTGHCGECQIRLSAIERGMENCAVCPDYAVCEKIQDFLNAVPQAKANLEAIRAA